ncbi:MAG: carbohydrate-binding family 9-like protein [Bryobacteraceae bacterium]
MLLSLLFLASGVIPSQYSQEDFALTADPASRNWKDAPAVVAENGPRGEPVPGHRTEIRSRWSRRYLYFLFTCPYETLNLKPDPSTATETNRLWTWDVAEVFVGADFQNIRRYKEFQVSPQGEWVDLDIDRDRPQPEGGWRWNSGFTVKARIDSEKKIWYGEMRIPLDTIDSRPPKKGLEMRVNLYRIQGPAGAKRNIAWQPTGAPSYHVPEAFGLLRLE